MFSIASSTLVALSQALSFTFHTLVLFFTFFSVPLYTCPGCQKPISESQPLDHCLGCAEMNQRQNARNRDRSASASDGNRTTEYLLAFLFRRPSQQHGPGSAPPPGYDDPDMAFPWEMETGSSENRRQTSTANNGASDAGDANAPQGNNQAERP